MSRRGTWIVLLLLALVVTLLNALKPLHMDDPMYYYRARQVAAQPLQPFAFEIFWDNWPTAAHEDVLATVVPYWLGTAIALFGERPVLWKLWFLPFSLMFVASVHALARRFARPWSLPLTILIILSPAMLPSWNLMADGPVMALTLAALAVFMAACERRSWALAVLAGILVGLAQQTKYNAALTLPAILLWAVINRKLALGILSAVVALAVFAAVEGLLWTISGQTPFLWNLSHAFPDRWSPLDMATAMLTALGALNIVCVSLLLAASRLPAWYTILSLTLSCAGYAAIAAGPHEQFVFSVFGGLFLLAIIAALIVSFRRGRVEAVAASRGIDLFLAGWLAIEVAGYFWAAPFPAARRLLTIIVVTTLIAGRCAALLDPMGRRRRLVHGVVSFGVLLGLGFYTLDLREAWVQAAAPRVAAQLIRDKDPNGTIWYIGHWGFAYYAEQAGMKALIPEHSSLREGDWIVEPTRVDCQQVKLNDFELVKKIALDDRVPLATVHGFYGSGIPLAHLQRPRMLVRIFRAPYEMVPQSSLPPEYLATWARTRRDWEGVKYALPTLLRYLEDANPKSRVLMAETLGELGPRVAGAAPALSRRLSDPDPAVQEAAARALRQIASTANPKN